MSLVSVIVPVYNTEDYLESCLMSLREQTMKEIEVIIVNDCTPDHSMCIAQRFAKQDMRFRIIEHTYNKKLGGARNTGLKAAKSDYVMFLDSDDAYPVYAIEVLYNKIRNTKAQMVIGNMVWKRKEGDIPVEYINEKITMYKLLRRENLRYINSSYWYLGQACNRIYEKKMLLDKKIEFQEGVYWEDVFFSLLVWWNSENISFIDEIVYLRTEREDESNPSITQSYTMEKYLDRDCLMNVVFEFFKINAQENEEKRKIARNILNRILQTTRKMLDHAEQVDRKKVMDWYQKHERMALEYQKVFQNI